MKLILTLGGSKYAALGGAILLCLTVSILIASVIEPPLKALLRRLLFRIGDLSAWKATLDVAPARQSFGD